MSADSAIRAEFLAKTYRSGASEVVVFDDLCLEVRRGELIAIIGESGAGKSTLLHLLGGLDRPSKGRIYFGLRELGSLSDKQLADFRNKTLGFVWQSPSLLP
ncbi:MAG TPA: ATP-binding cassette domain-containing protein, partial [Bryobacteraceae bacterium]